MGVVSSTLVGAVGILGLCIILRHAVTGPTVSSAVAGKAKVLYMIFAYERIGTTRINQCVTNWNGKHN